MSLTVHIETLTIIPYIKTVTERLYLFNHCEPNFNKYAIIMKKIPFSLEQHILHPEWKIETQVQEPVKIVFTEGLGKRPICAVIYDGDTTDAAWYTKDGKDFRGEQGLFFVTEELEFTEFKLKMDEFAEELQLAVTDCKSAEYKACNGNLQLIIDRYATELHDLAFKEFMENK